MAICHLPTVKKTLTDWLNDLHETSEKWKSWEQRSPESLAILKGPSYEWKREERKCKWREVERRICPTQKCWRGAPVHTRSDHRRALMNLFYCCRYFSWIYYNRWFQSASRKSSDHLTSQFLSLLSFFNLIQHVNLPTHNEHHVHDLAITSLTPLMHHLYKEKCCKRGANPCHCCPSDDPCHAVFLD